MNINQIRNETIKTQGASLFNINSGKKSNEGEIKDQVTLGKNNDSNFDNIFLLNKSFEKITNNDAVNFGTKNALEGAIFGTIGFATTAICGPLAGQVISLGVGSLHTAYSTLQFMAGSEPFESETLKAIVLDSLTSAGATYLGATQGLAGIAEGALLKGAVSSGLYLAEQN